MSTCANTRIMSLIEEFLLVFCSQFQLLLLLHKAVPSHHTHVASIHRQQHHRGSKRPVAEVGDALPRHHVEDPEGNKVRASSASKYCTKSRDRK